MTDIALQQLMARLGAARGNLLWLADEHVDRAALAALPARAGLQAISNRCDVVAALTSSGVDAALSDFDFSALPRFDAVFFRVAKEKALVHHVINRALEHLQPGGELWLSGYKNDGIKTYLDKAAARAGSAARLERHGAVTVGAIAASETPGTTLDDQDYTQLRHIEFGAEFSAWSKPGIFGWQKIDKGSAFLCEHLAAVWPQPPQRVLDLGCGYGYLTLMAARTWPQAEFVATDNNIAAVNATAFNIEQSQIRGSAVCSDAGAGLHGGFDAVLCNPPFHQGFAVEGELTTRFLQSVHRLLARRGRALLVVNQFIPLERKAAAHFGRVDVIACNAGFKLIALEH